MDVKPIDSTGYTDYSESIEEEKTIKIEEVARQNVFMFMFNISELNKKTPVRIPILTDYDAMFSQFVKDRTTKLERYNIIIEIKLMFKHGITYEQCFVRAYKNEHLFDSV